MDAFYYTMLGSIIGDALGTPLDGLGREHLKAVFKTLDCYVDPAPALKGKMERWKKPALYSSISQFSLLLGLLQGQGKPGTGLLTRLIAAVQSMPDNGEDDTAIFRNPGAAERRFIHGARTSSSSSAYLQPLPCSRILPLMVPLSFHDDPGTAFLSMAIAHAFTRDSYCVAGSLIYLLLLKKIHDAPAGSVELLDAAGASAREAQVLINSAPHHIFDLGCNPETLSRSVEQFLELFRKLEATGDLSRAEETIIGVARPLFPGPVTRATINHPLLILPFAIACTARTASPESHLYDITMMGGTTSVLASIAGALAGALWGGGALPEELCGGIVNRHRIAELVKQISHPRSRQSITPDEYVASELSLTRKEKEERKAKLKHMKEKPKKKMTREQREEALTRHVVESWTKVDKARWKKEKRKKQE